MFSGFARSRDAPESNGTQACLTPHLPRLPPCPALSPVCTDLACPGAQARSGSGALSPAPPSTKPSGVPRQSPAACTPTLLARTLCPEAVMRKRFIGGGLIWTRLGTNVYTYNLERFLKPSFVMFVLSRLQISPPSTYGFCMTVVFPRPLMA